MWRNDFLDISYNYSDLHSCHSFVEYIFHLASVIFEKMKHVLQSDDLLGFVGFIEICIILVRRQAVFEMANITLIFF